MFFLIKLGLQFFQSNDKKSLAYPISVLVEVYELFLSDELVVCQPWLGVKHKWKGLVCHQHCHPRKQIFQEHFPENDNSCLIQELLRLTFFSPHIFSTLVGLAPTQGHVLRIHTLKLDLESYFFPLYQCLT